MSAENELVWYSDHPTIGEIQINGHIIAALTGKIRLISAAMLAERTPGIGELSGLGACKRLELMMGGSGLGFLSKANREESSIEVKIPRLQLGLLIALNGMGDDGSERKEWPLREEMSTELSNWMITAWNEAMAK